MNCPRAFFFGLIWAHLFLQCTTDYLDSNMRISVANHAPKLKAGLFTGMGLTPGGGERYFLTSALTLHKMGYDVDIIVEETNLCRNLTCVSHTLKALRIPISFEEIHLRVIPSYDNLNDNEYDIFYILGNYKYPEHKGKGRYNMYMCQFPFDFMKLNVFDHIMGYYTSFHQVIVNSRFTHDWYIRATQKGLGVLMKTDSPYPTVTIVHPPVEPFEMKNSSLNSTQARTLPRIPDITEPISIAMCGRFFRGRQNKGHDHALKLLVELKALTKRKIHMYMIGFVHPDQDSDEYVQELRQNSTNFGLSVTFLLNADSYDIAEALLKSTIYWHLTGIQVLSRPRDPASFEHFGIAIVEAMYSGCIPIVTSLGGVTDIVKHNYNGLIASTEHEFLTHTLSLLVMPKDGLEKIRHNVLQTADRFSVTSFMNNLQAVITRGLRSQMLRNITMFKMNDLSTLSVQTSFTRTKLTAVIIETGYATNLKLSVRNVMHYLGFGWRLHVYYSGDNGNEQHMQGILSGCNAQFIPLTQPVLTKGDFDELMKSPVLWKRYSKTEKLFIFRSDTLLMRKGVEEFLNYDFITAPLLDSMLHTPRTIPTEQFTFSDSIFDYAGLFERGVGHGSGVSLRTAGAMLSIVNRYGNDTTPEESEAVFFARHAKLMGYKVADNVTSYTFAWEAELPELGSLRKPPLALQSAWLFMREDLINGLISRNAIPDKKISVIRFPPTNAELVSLLLTPPQKPTVKSTSEDSLVPDAASSYPLLNGRNKESILFWKFIHNPRVLVGGNRTRMSRLLENSNLITPKDLKDCDDSLLDEIKDLVKPLQRLKMMNIIQPLAVHVDFPVEDVFDGAVLRPACSRDLLYVNGGERFKLRHTRQLIVLNKTQNDIFVISCDHIAQLDTIVPLRVPQSPIPEDSLRDEAVLRFDCMDSSPTPTHYFVRLGERYLLKGTVDSELRALNKSSANITTVNCNHTQLLSTLLPLSKSDQIFPLQVTEEGALSQPKCSREIMYTQQNKRHRLKNLKQLESLNKSLADVIMIDCTHMDQLDALVPMHGAGTFRAADFYEGVIVRPSCSRDMYVINGGRRNKLRNMDHMLSLNKTLDDVVVVNCARIDLLDALAPPTKTGFRALFPAKALAEGGVVRVSCERLAYYVLHGRRHPLTSLQQLEAVNRTIDDVTILDCEFQSVYDALVPVHKVHIDTIKKGVLKSILGSIRELDPVDEFPVEVTFDNAIVKMSCSNEYFHVSAGRRHLLKNLEKQLDLLNKTKFDVKILSCDHQEEFEAAVPIYIPSFVLPRETIKDGALVISSCTRVIYFVREGRKFTLNGVHELMGLNKTIEDVIQLECGAQFDLWDALMPDGTTKAPFPRESVREGSLIRPKCSREIYYIEGGLRNKLHSRDQLLSMNKTFDDVVVIDCAHMEYMDMHFPIKGSKVLFSSTMVKEGAVIRPSCSRDIYFIADHRRHKLKSIAQLQTLNKTLEDVVVVDCSDMEKLDALVPLRGAARILPSSVSADGTVLRMKCSPDIFYVHSGRRHKLKSWNMYQLELLTRSLDDIVVVDCSHVQLLDAVVPIAK